MSAFYINAHLASITMSINRIQYFIKNILQNSKLNREKFVKSRKTYSETILKNKNRNSHNLIFKRNFGTASNFPPPNNNNGGNWVLMLMMATASYIIINKKF